MAYIGPGNTTGYVPAWDGSKWVPTPPTTGVGAPSAEFPYKKSVQWLNVLPSNNGAVGLAQFTHTNVGGTNDIPTYTKSDSFLCLPFFGVKTSNVAGNNAAFKNGATASSVQVWLGAVANAGGFSWKGRLGLPAAWLSTQSSWIGFRNDVTLPASGTNPSAFVNCLGFGHDPGDTTLQFMHNDGSGTCTKVSCTGLTLNAKVAYNLEIHVEPNSSTVYFKATDIINNVSFSSFVNTNTPATTTGMTWFTYCCNGVTAAVASVAWGCQYIEFQ